MGERGSEGDGQRHCTLFGQTTLEGGASVAKTRCGGSLADNHGVTSGPSD